jgi:Fe-S-cluster-containing hydrogenase component 2
MATIITTECISCGACEPECPNNAISQGETIFVIDPKLCTECVGFHDYEACAAVCPVDCCVTDPNNVESEEALIARARALHPDTPFGDNFESRFRKGQGKPAGAASKSAVSEQATSPAQNVSAKAGLGAISSATPMAAEYVQSEMNFIQLPEVDSWDIPVRCYKCKETHVESVRSFMIGNVIFCPHCNKSMVVRDNLNFHIRSLLKDSYEKWDKDQREFTRRREKELAEFTANRAKEAQAFETHQQQELEKIRRQFEALGESYDAPGKPIKKGSRFAWG